jgi:hypothetical protein
MLRRLHSEANLVAFDWSQFYLLLFPQRLAHNVCRYERVYSIIVLVCELITIKKQSENLKLIISPSSVVFFSIFINLCYLTSTCWCSFTTSLTSLTKPALSCEIWTKPLLTPISTKQPKLVILFTIPYHSWLHVFDRFYIRQIQKFWLIFLI